MGIDSEDGKPGRIAALKGRIGSAVDRTRTALSDAAASDEAMAVAAWTRKAGAGLKEQAQALGHDIRKSDLGRAATKGAVVGAVAGVPLPVVGPIGGAVLGAATGALLNLKYGIGGPPREPEASPSQASENPRTGNETELLVELDRLRKAGVITDTEFDEQKAKLLRRI